MTPKFKVGDEVRKVKGYAFDGIVMAVVELEDIGTRYIVRQADIHMHDLSGAEMVLVEDDRLICGGALHIFSEEQLEIIDNSGFEAVLGV